MFCAVYGNKTPNTKAMTSAPKFYGNLRPNTPIWIIEEVSGRRKIAVDTFSQNEWDALNQSTTQKVERENWKIFCIFFFCSFASATHVTLLCVCVREREGEKCFGNRFFVVLLYWHLLQTNSNFFCFSKSDIFPILIIILLQNTFLCSISSKLANCFSSNGNTFSYFFFCIN